MRKELLERRAAHFAGLGRGTGGVTGPGVIDDERTAILFEPAGTEKGHAVVGGAGSELFIEEQVAGLGLLDITRTQVGIVAHQSLRVCKFGPGGIGLRGTEEARPMWSCTWILETLDTAGGGKEWKRERAGPGNVVAAQRFGEAEAEETGAIGDGLGQGVRVAGVHGFGDKGEPGSEGAPVAGIVEKEFSGGGLP